MARACKKRSKAPKGLDVIAQLHQWVETLARERPQAKVVVSLADDIDGTYEAVLNALDQWADPDT